MSPDKGLIDYLAQFLTEERRVKIDAALENRSNYLTVVLENIYQPHNASAVLRSAECFGVQNVHIIENEYSYNINKDVVMGAHKWLDLHKYNESENNTMACINSLKQSGYKIVATTPHKDDCLLDDLDLNQKMAIMFGTEKDGLSQEAIDAADAYVRIPMYGFTESFNISVSAAITMHHLVHKLRQSDIDWLMSEDERLELKLEWCKRCIKQIDKHIASYQKK